MKTILFKRIIFFICVGALVVFTAVNAISASDVSDLQDELDDTNEQQDELEDAVSELEAYLDDLDDQMLSANEEIADINDQIEELESEIETTSTELEIAENNVEDQYEEMKLRIKYLYESPDVDFFESLFSADSFGDFISSYSYIQALVEYDRDMLEELEENSQEISEKKASLEEDMAELETLQAEAESKKEEVITLLSNTQDTISEYEDQIDAFEEQALEYEEAIYQAQLATATKTSAGTAETIENTYVEQEGDEKLLATLIYCEAANQPYEGKLAVASVVLNRVNSSKFAASTVYDVIMSEGQFSPVTSGRFALYYSLGVTDECYEAAREVLDGNITGSWLFFVRNDGTREGDIIGDHVFFYEW